jgi:hypothetical protein
VQIVVWANSLNDDGALIVSGLITGGTLGPTMLVVPEADFKRLASRTHWNDQPIYSMSFGMHPHSNSRWLPYLVPSERLADRFMPEKMSIQELIRPPQWRSDLGFLGESETIRLLAESSALNLFRPFPDLETSELAILHIEKRTVVGVQVKTGSVDAAQPTARIHIRASSFRPSPTTHFVALAWMHEENRFHDQCLLIPSELIRGVCEPGELDGHIKFDWYPGSSEPTKLDRFRIPLHTLRAEIENRLRR